MTTRRWPQVKRRQNVNSGIKLAVHFVIFEYSQDYYKGWFTLRRQWRGLFLSLVMGCMNTYVTVQTWQQRQNFQLLCHEWEQYQFVGSPLNKFEQISSDGHQMLLAEGWGQGVPHVSCTGTGPRGSHVCCPGFRARARGWSHVWCPVGYPAQWGPTIYHGQWAHGTPSPRWLTDTTENISFQ